MRSKAASTGDQSGGSETRDARLLQDLGAQSREQFAEFLGLFAGTGDEDDAAGEGEGGRMKDEG